VVRVHGLEELVVLFASQGVVGGQKGTRVVDFLYKCTDVLHF
jgi:hypothetical protein